MKLQKQRSGETFLRRFFSYRFMPMVTSDPYLIGGIFIHGCRTCSYETVYVQVVIRFTKNISPISLDDEQGAVVVGSDTEGVGNGPGRVGRNTECRIVPNS